MPARARFSPAQRAAQVRLQREGKALDAAAAAKAARQPWPLWSLRPYQIERLQSFRNCAFFGGSGPNNRIWQIHRRGCKTTTSFLEAILACHLHPGFAARLYFPKQPMISQTIYKGKGFHDDNDIGGKGRSFNPMNALPGKRGQHWDFKLSSNLIEFPNGSTIWFAGMDWVLKHSEAGQAGDRGVGAHGVWITEYAFGNFFQIMPVVKPMLNETKGILTIESTPNGENHFTEAYDYAVKNPGEWTSCHLTLYDTKKADGKTPVITWRYRNNDEALGEDPYSVWVKDVLPGHLTEKKAREEYLLVRHTGTEASVYEREMDLLRTNGQIRAMVPLILTKPVYAGVDIPYKKSLGVMVFAQIHEGMIYVVGTIETKGEAPGVLARNAHAWLKKRSLELEKIFLPHDGSHAKWQSTRTSALEDVFPSFVEAGFALPQLQILKKPGGTGESGGRSGEITNHCKPMFPRLIMGHETTGRLVKALTSYRWKIGANGLVAGEKPLDDDHADYADAMRSLLVGIRFFTPLGRAGLRLSTEGQAAPGGDPHSRRARQRRLDRMAEKALRELGGAQDRPQAYMSGGSRTKPGGKFFDALSYRMT